MARRLAAEAALSTAPVERRQLEPGLSEMGVRETFANA